MDKMNKTIEHIKHLIKTNGTMEYNDIINLIDLYPEDVVFDYFDNLFYKNNITEDSTPQEIIKVL